ncbi:hypothetical protein [Streptomyces gobitricini]|uniref:Tox-REase-7 domain-containing protein n=1 Tax=Streptomyces gobitricini TaxID=68211 RepID=A0ABN3M8G6_9ACTN
MSDNAPVDPFEVPEFTGDEAVLAEKVKALSGAGVKISTVAGDVHTSFGGLRAFYRAPEAEQLFATTKPVQDKALEVGSDLCVIAGALGKYADDIRPLVKRLNELRQDAVNFREKIADDDKWREDGDLTDENLARRNEIAEVWAQFQEAERTCHDKIAALVGGPPLKVDDGSHQPGMYGYDAEMLKQAESLPWGDAVAESTPAWQVWEHGADFAKGFFVDGVVGTIKSLGTLVGTDGWDAAGEAWKGLGLLSTGVLISTTPAVGLFWGADDKDMPPLLRDSRTAMKETGKALIAYDKWDENPARAGGLVTFNVLSVLATRGAGSAASGAAKGGTAAKALSFAGKAGQALDPTTYLLKGATASMRKIGDVMAGLRGMSHVDVSLPPGTVELPSGASVLPDGTLRLPDGAPVPPGVVEVPPGTVRLPADTPIPPGSIDFGDGVVRLPADTSPPPGAIPVPEGTLKVTDGTIALPEGTVKLPGPTGKTVYADPKGNLYNADGTLLQRAEDAKKETPPAAAPGADNPRVDAPAKVPAMAGAPSSAAGNAGIPARLGDSLDTNLGDTGRLDDGLPHRTSDAPSGPTARADDNLPAGGAGGHLPANDLDSTPAGGGHPGDGNNEPGGVLSGNGSGNLGNTPGSSSPDQTPSATGGGTGARSNDVLGDGPDGRDSPRPADPGENTGGPDTVKDSAGGKPDSDGGDVTGKPDSDNPYAGEEPDYTRRTLLPADGPLTLRDVRNTRAPDERWQRGERFHRQMWRGDPERSYPVPTNNDPRYPVTRTGGRKVDVPVDLPDGRTVAVEVKTYGPYRTITLNDGTQKAVKNEVPLKKEIKEQIHKDIALRRLHPGYDPRWAFTHAGPSPELRAYLRKAKIVFVEYGPAPKKDQWDKPREK